MPSFSKFNKGSVVCITKLGHDQTIGDNARFHGFRVGELVTIRDIVRGSEGYYYRAESTTEHKNYYIDDTCIISSSTSLGNKHQTFI